MVSNYPRQTRPKRTPEQLVALASAYRGANLALIGTLVVSILARLSHEAAANEPQVSPAAYLLGSLGVVFVAVAAMNYPPCRNLAFGKGWAPARGILAALLVGLLSALFCGLLPYIAIYYTIKHELEPLGVRLGTISVKRDTLEFALERLRAPEAAAPGASPPPGLGGT